MSNVQTLLVHSSPAIGTRYDSVQGVDAIYKLDKDKVSAAMAAAKGNGGDEVFYQVGEDTYVATAHSMNRGAYGGFQDRFVAKPYWNPVDDQVGIKASKDAPTTGLTKMVAKGFDNEFQTASEYANSKISNWAEWLGSLFGWTHRREWRKHEQPSYDADGFARFGKKLEANKTHV